MLTRTVLRRTAAWPTFGRVAGVLVLSVILTASLPASAATVPRAPAVAQINEVTNWNRIATETLVAFPGPTGGAPPALQINMGMTQGAVYDAVNAIEPRHQPYLLDTPFNPTASKEAAAATAAYRVLSNIVSTVPRSHPVPESGELVGGAGHGIRDFARADTRFLVQERGDRGGERRGRRDDRRTAGRRTLRTITVGAER